MTDNELMDFWERVREEVRLKNTTQEWVAQNANIPFGTFKRWLSQKTMPNADQALAIAHSLGTTVEYLFTGNSGTAPVTWTNPDEAICPVPILDQKVAAGRGQELLESVEVIGILPFLKRMLRGEDPTLARALEVRGDSMTGVEIFDGDLVVFLPGSIRGDGIYVLRVNDSLIVKRVEFDEISRKLRIMSENPRYPDRIESADGQTVEVVGKVYGWVHAHPY
jgi:phage repressor protein C with HTH and peptisase S24 domain